MRNRAYLGQISFRGTHHPAPHTPLIEQGLFEQAQAILKERGDDHSLRRSNQSDYLLTGLVKCVRCGKRYLGAAANGNGGRYRYYVCFSRQRYGSATCDAHRLPADELEQAILTQLEDLLAREDDVREAITNAFAELNNQQPKRDAELARLNAEVRKLDETLDRYFRAFENGTMPEQACAPRIADLTKRLSELRARRDELASDANDTPEPLSDDDLHALQAHVTQVIADGDPSARKALLQALVDEIRVQSRDEIYPFFTLPTVRPPYGSVRPGGFEPPTRGLEVRCSVP